MTHPPMTAGPVDFDRPPGRAAALALLGFIALVGILTVFGASRLWPTGAPMAPATSTNFAAPGVTFPRAVITAVLSPCKAIPAAADLGSAASTGPTLPDTTNAPGTTAPSIGHAPCGKLTATVEDGAGAGQSVTVDAPTEVLQAGLGMR